MARSVMILAKVPPVVVASIVVILVIVVMPMRAMMAMMVLSLVATETVRIPLSFAVASIVVTSRLWNCDVVYVYAPGYGRSL